MLFAALEILFRQRWRYLTLFVLLPMVAAVVCVQMYPKATVAESLWIGNQTYLNTELPYYQRYETPAQMTLSDMTQYFQTGEFSNKVTRLLEGRHAFLSPAELAATRGTLAADLIGKANGANLLTVTATCPRAALCADILSASMQVFEDHEAAVLTSQQTVATQVYTRQLVDAQAALSQAQTALAAYQSAHPNETPAQQSTDSQLSLLNQNVANQKASVATTQTKLDTVTSSSLAAKLENASLYQLIDPPYRTSGRLSSLPKKQMLIAAAVFWALGLFMLVASLRLHRAILHPAQLERSLGFAPVAVTAPLHQDRRAATGRLLGAGGSR